MRLGNFCIAAFLITCGPTAFGDHPDTSIYQLASKITDQGGHEQSLDTYQGHPVIISMFYGSCPHVCPMLISAIQMTEKELTPENRANLRVLLVSIDPEKDTPEALQEVADQHRVDAARWKLTRASDKDVRKIAAVLGIKYRKLPDGEFNHSTVLTLLDEDGVIRARTSKIPGVDPEFLQELRDAI